MFRTEVIIRKPTTTSAVDAASNGTTCTSGDRNMASRNSAPVTRLASPVRAPSPTPAALSMYEVLLDTLAAPPAAAATESTMRMRWLFGGVASSSSRSPSAPMATIVPIVSRKSASRSVKPSRMAVTAPTAENDPSRLKSPSSPKSGRSTIWLGSLGTFRPQPVGFGFCPGTTDGPTLARASRTIASTGAPDEAGVHEADDRDEQADAHADRDLELPGHGAEDRLAEPRENEEQDDQPFDDDEAHRVRPG